MKVFNIAGKGAVVGAGAHIYDLVEGRTCAPCRSGARSRHAIKPWRHTRRVPEDGQVLDLEEQENLRLQAWFRVFLARSLYYENQVVK